MVLVAGHVSLDLFPALGGPLTLEPGDLVEVGPVVLSTGGAVTNTGLALDRLGVPVRLVARLSADLFGRAISEALARRREGLASGLIVADGEATSYTIVIRPTTHSCCSRTRVATGRGRHCSGARSRPANTRSRSCSS